MADCEAGESIGVFASGVAQTFPRYNCYTERGGRQMDGRRRNESLDSADYAL